MNRENLIIIIILGALAGVCIYFGKTELAGTCIGALATALTTSIKGVSNEKAVSAVPADHSGL